MSLYQDMDLLNFSDAKFSGGKHRSRSQSFGVIIDSDSGSTPSLPDESESSGNRSAGVDSLLDPDYVPKRDRARTFSEKYHPADDDSVEISSLGSENYLSFDDNVSISSLSSVEIDTPSQKSSRSASDNSSSESSDNNRDTIVAPLIKESFYDSTHNQLETDLKPGGSSETKADLEPILTSINLSDPQTQLESGPSDPKPDLDVGDPGPTASDSEDLISVNKNDPEVEAIMDPGAQDEVDGGRRPPGWIAVLKSTIFEWESFQLEDYDISHCSYKRLDSSGNSSEKTEAWVLVLRKTTSLYIGLFLFDVELNFQHAVPIDAQTVISCDEDLIGTGHRIITVCYHSLEPRSQFESDFAPDLCKLEIRLSGKFKQLEDNYFSLMQKVQQLYSVRSASEHMLSSDWLNKNKTWVEQFSTKAKRLRNAVRGQTTQQRQPIPPQTVLTSSAEHELTASYGDLDLGSPRNDQPLRSKTFHHLSPNHGQRGGSLQVDPSGNNRSTQYGGHSSSRPVSPASRRPKIFTNPEDQKYVEFRKLRLFVTTFNVNMQSSGDEDMPAKMGLREVVLQWLQCQEFSPIGAPGKEPSPDLIAICLQECGALNRAANIIYNLDAKIQSGWREAMTEVLSRLGLEMFVDHNIGCTYMIIFVKKSLSRQFSLHHKDELPLGTGGLTANKGAVLIQLGLQSRDQIFVFVGVHLAPHDNAQDARLKQIARICEEFGSLLRKSSFVFWMGDFNFRAATNDPITEQFDFLIPKNKMLEEFSNYRYKDEWSMIHRNPYHSERNFFFDMHESHIAFAPSYKFEPKTTSSTDTTTGLEYHPYVTSHRPSWCDRIFFYAKDGASSSNNKLQITKYDAEFKCILSDHKPVYVKVLAEVEFFDSEKKAKDLRATEIENNSIQPNAVLDEALHNIPSDVECFKMWRTYRIDSHLELRENIADAVFLFQCSCGEKCKYYNMQFGTGDHLLKGTSDVKESREMIEHIKTHNTPVSFIKVNQYYGPITPGNNTSIGYDVRITERNIHEIYKLRPRRFAKVVKQSKTGTPFEQAQIDLVFCQYRGANDKTVGWLKGAERYIAVNLNVKPYMHGIPPTALCFIERPLCQMTVVEISEIVEHAENVIRPECGQRSAKLPTWPPLDCPKEVVKAVDTILQFIDSIDTQHRKMKFVTNLFVAKSVDLSDNKSESSDVMSLNNHQDVLIFSDDDDINRDLTDRVTIVNEEEGEGRDRRRGKGGGLKLAAMGASITTDSEEQANLDLAIDWLTGVTNYNTSPCSTLQENANFVLCLSEALLLYLKSIEKSLFGTDRLPPIQYNLTTHTQLLESLKVAEHSRVLISYLFAFISETVIKRGYKEQLNSEKLIYFTRAEATYRHQLDTLKTTLVDACFPPSGDDNEYDRRMQVVEILLRRPSNIQGARCSSRPEPLIVLPS
ncbi:uncharacterized protein LOC142351992 isoform X2 [Convolutriloba macropyga]|uniref:uncharacterized protein LOC142351992 isoform X2 n=1 Tax=Convolutriloba macropyga TaxID=536237 RepID=UPI003F51D39D